MLPTNADIERAQGRGDFDAAHAMIMELGRAELSFKTAFMLMKPSCGAEFFGSCFADVRAFVENGGDVNLRTEVLKRTGLHFAMENACPELVCYLVAHGADAESRDIHGLSPHACAADGRMKDVLAGALSGREQLLPPSRRDAAHPQPKFR